MYILGCGPTTGSTGKTERATPVTIKRIDVFLSKICFCNATVINMVILKNHLYIRPTNIIAVKKIVPKNSINGLLELICKVGPFLMIPLNASQKDTTHTRPYPGNRHSLQPATKIF